VEEEDRKGGAVVRRQRRMRLMMRSWPWNDRSGVGRRGAERTRLSTGDISSICKRLQDMT
jgi:hypothetical protein